jgi:hypothetical protein
MQVCRPESATAFSSEVDTGSREENASKQQIRASVLIQSEPKRLYTSRRTLQRCLPRSIQSSAAIGTDGGFTRYVCRPGGWLQYASATKISAQ